MKAETLILAAAIGLGAALVVIIFRCLRRFIRNRRPPRADMHYRTED